MKCDLKELRVSLMADNHIELFPQILFPQERRSLMQSKKNRGPRTESWGTRHVIDYCFELLLLIETYCCLFAR